MAMPDRPEINRELQSLAGERGRRAAQLSRLDKTVALSSMIEAGEHLIVVIDA
jgi:hypothetical protein